MDLEEMKATWSQMSDELEQQKKLTNTLIMEMTEQKFKTRFSRLTTYETTGAVICFAALAFILLNLDKMNTWYLWLCAFASIIFLSILPILGLRAVKGINNIDLQRNSYKKTLVEYTRKKRNMLLIQKSSVFASIVVLWTTTPVFGTIVKGEDFFKQEHSPTMLFLFAAVTLGVLLFALLGYRHYKRITTSAEKLIKELENNKI